MWKRRRSTSDFSEEIQAHLAMEAERLRQEGLSEEDAMYAARRTMGNVTAVEERFYDANHWRWFDQLRQDVRCCFRQWRKRPLMTMAALLTIALGAGLNVAVFRVVWATLLRPLPYKDSSRLVQVWAVEEPDGGIWAADRRVPDKLTVEQWRSGNRSFQSLASYRAWRVTVGSGGDPERVTTGIVSAEFLPLLGASVVLGRTFTPDDVRTGVDDVVVLAYGYWRARFNGDRNLIGKSIRIDGAGCRVIGVLTPGFRDLITEGAKPPKLYLPISRIGTGAFKDSSGLVAGRLREGVGIEQARSELEAIARHSPVGSGQSRKLKGVNITRLQDEIGYALRPALLVMFAAAACLLLIACANIANLLLAQAIGRRQEIAIRAAIGASRGRLVRQFITEAFVLSFAGAGLGLSAGWALCRLMVALYPGTLPRIAESGTTGVMILFAVLLATLSAMFFGVLPALLATRRMGDASLRTGRGGALPSAGRWRDALVCVQVAATAILLAGAGLLTKSFVTLRSVDPGFEREHLFTAYISLPEMRYQSNEDRVRFAQDWVDRLKRIPGVQGAAVTNTLPLAFRVLTEVRFDGPGQGQMCRAGARSVMGDFFDTLGLRVMQGRGLTASDDNRRDVAVVNESFARTYLKHTSPLGAVLKFGPVPATVVGVVHDLHTLGLQQKTAPEIYMPFGAMPSPLFDVVVRSALPQEEVAAAMRRQLRGLDSSLVLAQFSTMDRVVDGEYAQPRFQTALLGLFGIIAAVLAAVGIYGVIAQGVRARTNEYGVRLALGAAPADVFWLVVKQGVRAPLIGLAIGTAAAMLIGRILESLLFGVTPRDPAVLCSAAALLALICVASCGLPARQACRTDAAQALRDE